MLYLLGQGGLVLSTQPLKSPKGENLPALDHRKLRVDAPPLGGWEVREAFENCGWMHLL